MNSATKEQIRFVLEDDNELMQAALDPNSGLDEEDRHMNQELIQRHERILTKLDRDELPSQEDLQLIRDAKEIHLNDTVNLNGHHEHAWVLDAWLDNMMELSKDEAMRIIEEYLDMVCHVPARVYRALHTLWEEATPNDACPVFDENGRCLKCGSTVSFADATDAVVFVGHEVVKRYDGDISNRNCVRCTYPKQYGDFAHFDAGDDNNC